MNKETLNTELNEFCKKHNAKIYGDGIIGYRAYTTEYLDKELGVIYERYGGSDCEYWNSVCDEIKSGDHNW